MCDVTILSYYNVIRGNNALLHLQCPKNDIALNFIYSDNGVDILLLWPPSRCYGVPPVRRTQMMSHGSLPGTQTMNESEASSVCSERRSSYWLLSCQSSLYSQGCSDSRTEVGKTWWRHQMENFLRYWPFVRGIHWWPVDSPLKGQWRGALMFSLICAWTNGWANNRDAGELRRDRFYHDVTVMMN